MENWRTEDGQGRRKCKQTAKAAEAAAASTPASQTANTTASKAHFKKVFSSPLHGISGSEKPNAFGSLGSSPSPSSSGGRRFLLSHFNSLLFFRGAAAPFFLSGYDGGFCCSLSLGPTARTYSSYSRNELI